MAGETKRCLYEVLGVSRDASPDEIRSAYRKLALQLHPDKVAAAGGSTSHAAATAAFQELANAYEVLSDPRERSYYDSHRSQILFADASSAAASKRPFSSFFGVDIFSFFSSSAYSGFSDTGRGFYRVYGDLFASIYDQELKFQSRMGLPSDAVSAAPLIGNLESPYTQVTAFYGYWMGFCTVMDFAWADVYDAAAGENRRSRRAMEEENRKVRKKARRDYNDSIRGLAEFVKKRDKRVTDMVMKRKEEEERRRAEDLERKKEEERKKAERVRLYEEPEWARVEEEEEVVVKDEDGNKGGEDELLYCIVCSKKFKSQKQWKNHEQSKKHRDRVAELREAMLDEEDHEAINGDVDMEEDGEYKKGDTNGDRNTELSKDDGDEDDGEVFKDSAHELCEEFDDGIRLEEEISGAVHSGLNDQHEDEESILEAMVSGHKSRNVIQKDPLDNSFTELVHSRSDSEEDGSMTYDNRKKGRRNRAKRKGGKGNADDAMLRRGLNEATDGGDRLERRNNDAKDTMSSSFAHPADAKGRSNTSDHASGKNPKSKKQQIDERGSNKGKKNKGASRSSNLCETCGETFDSRNKLFMHLGETGHAMLKSH